MTGVECEFFLVNPVVTEISNPAGIQAKLCYDQQALMRRYPVLREIGDSMLELGWGPYLNQSSATALSVFVRAAFSSRRRVLGSIFWASSVLVSSRLDLASLSDVSG